MVALGLSTSLGGILSGCRQARQHPRQATRQAESGRATIDGVWVELLLEKCVEAGSVQRVCICGAPVEIGSG